MTASHRPDRPDRAHRASALRRRAALLDAAAELVSEVGAGAVTHRAVAARAGVPLSTTSYFFGSIDELVTEALRQGTQTRVTDFDAAERAWLLGAGGSIESSIEAVADKILARVAAHEGTLVELYLAAGRQPELRPDVSDLVNRLADRIGWQLDRVGATDATGIAWALQALADGAMLHRLAGVDTDHRAHLVAGIKALVVAATLTEVESADLYGRLERRAGTVDSEPVDRV